LMAAFVVLELLSLFLNRRSWCEIREEVDHIEGFNTCTIDHVGQGLEINNYPDK